MGEKAWALCQAADLNLNRCLSVCSSLWFLVDELEGAGSQQPVKINWGRGNKQRNCY